MQVFTHDDVDDFNGAYPGQQCPWDVYRKACELVTVAEHPVVADAVRVLRDRRTPAAKFWRYTNLVCQALLWETLRKQPVQRVQTPSVHGDLVCESEKLSADDGVVWAVILRAGDAFKHWARELLPKSCVATYGVMRDERTLLPSQYKRSLPPSIAGRKVIVTDPMLATGGSAAHVLDDLIVERADDLTLVCIFAAVQGILRLKLQFPKLRIVTAAVDPILNDRGFIVPGCGDFGDRHNGTASDPEHTFATPSPLQPTTR
jgi:uracil phosphoribosyltransferase